MISKNELVLRNLVGLLLGFAGPVILFAFLIARKEHSNSLKFWSDFGYLFLVGMQVVALGILPCLLLGSILIYWLPRSKSALTLQALLLLIFTTVFSRWVFILIDLIDESDSILPTFVLSTISIALFMAPLIISVKRR
jgi:hypothetical protein